jgi:hypothetical protein
MKSRTLHYPKRILSVTSAFALTASLMMVAVIGGGGIMPVTTTTQQQVFAQPAGGDGETPSQAGGGQQTAANATGAGVQATTIEMTATEINETSRWAIGDNINPTIILTADVNNTITVSNPTDRIHELVIATTQGGEEGELEATRDIQPGGGQGELSIMPNATQALRYYCEYHPETMLGDIIIGSATTITNMTNATTTTTTTTMTNQTQ